MFRLARPSPTDVVVLPLPSFSFIARPVRLASCSVVDESPRRSVVTVGQVEPYLLLEQSDIFCESILRPFDADGQMPGLFVLPSDASLTVYKTRDSADGKATLQS